MPSTLLEYGDRSLSDSELLSINGESMYPARVSSFLSLTQMYPQSSRDPWRRKVHSL